MIPQFSIHYSRCRDVKVNDKDLLLAILEKVGDQICCVDINEMPREEMLAVVKQAEEGGYAPERWFIGSRRYDAVEEYLQSVGYLIPGGGWIRSIKP